nr:methyl-accepting chemotaxis protein [Gracilimonas mengyeensis]
MNHKLSINQKMWITASLISIMFLLLLFFFNRTLSKSENIGISNASEVMYEDQKDKVKVATHSMALSLGEIIKSEQDDQQQLEIIRGAVDPIRFESDQSGYFFVYHKTTVVALPPKKELIGNDLSDSKDTQGIYFVRELYKEAKNGGGFVDYVFPKPGAGDQPKIGYAEMIPGTDYWIGTGVYLDNIATTRAHIEEQIGEAVRSQNLIMYLFVVPLFLGILVALFFISRSIVIPLRKVSENLSDAANQVSSASAMVSQSGQSLAEGSTQQAASIQETSASLSELNSKTHENSENARRADHFMQETNTVIESADQEMKNLAISMTQISESSNEIHRIIKTIDDIAFQTNLLALNAAVEAARAGDAGAGFAVVASEVRSLAVRAAESARNTTQLIDTTSKRIQEGEESAERTKVAFSQIQDSSSKVADIIAEISTASEEQANGIEQISTAVNEMNTVTQQNTATAEEAAGSSEEMAAQAKEMENMAVELSLVVNGNQNQSALKTSFSPSLKSFAPGKKSWALRSFLILLFATFGLAKAQTVKIGGFVSSETYFDSKEGIASRESNVLLFSKKPMYDNLGNDLTDVRSFHMVSFNSRLRASVSEVEAFGAKSSAVIEFDFLGTGESFVNMPRMRHAYVNLDWEKSSLLMGQYWHPMFNPICFPQVMGWGGAAPVNVLSRNNQVRFTYQLSPSVSANISALSHRDFTSNGPDGYSSKYIRNSGIPEMNLHMEYKNESIMAGFTSGFKSIKPRTVTPAGYKTDETLQSWHANAFITYTSKKIHAKFTTIYGQNMTNFLMIGGYAEKSVQPEKITYTNLTTSSYWTEISSRGEKFKAALFAGYTINHGASETIIGSTPVFYGRGTDIASIYRIAPRITFKNGPLLWGLEYTWTSAAYGTPDIKGKVRNTEDVSMYRIQIAAIYTF